MRHEVSPLCYDEKENGLQNKLIWLYLTGKYAFPLKTILYTFDLLEHLRFIIKGKAGASGIRLCHILPPYPTTIILEKDNHKKSY